MENTNGKNWLAEIVGDIYGEIEEFCLDVQEVVCKDAVNYAESKLQKVGADVRSFYLEFMQEVITSSQERASEEVLSDMPPLESTDSYGASETAEGDNLGEGSWSIKNYSDVDSESCGKTTQHVPISQAEAMPSKSEGGCECASLMEGLREDFDGLDTCTDDRSTVKSLYCVSPEGHVSIIPDVASSNAFLGTIELDCSSQEPHSVNKLIKLDESYIIVDNRELCSAPNEINEQRPMQNEVLENMTSKTKKDEFDESEWELISFKIEKSSEESAVLLSTDIAESTK